jgi:hypothetical protein
MFIQSNIYTAGKMNQVQLHRLTRMNLKNHNNITVIKRSKGWGDGSNGIGPA